MIHLLDRINKSIRQRQGIDNDLSFTDMFSRFRNILSANNQVLDLMTGMGDKLGGDYIFDSHYIEATSREISDLVYRLISDLNYMASSRYKDLNSAFGNINHQIEDILSGKPQAPSENQWVMFHESVSSDMEEVIGSKNTVLADLKNILGLNVTEGFAVTTEGFHLFIEFNKIQEKIKEITDQWQRGEISTQKASSAIKPMIMNGDIPPRMKKQVSDALQQLPDRSQGRATLLAIRSSAIGEDGTHSFAGQYLSLLNEPKDCFFTCYKSVIASIYNETAMEYRQSIGFEEHEVSMAVVCSLMVIPTVSGVMYTMDPVSPERHRIIINASWGLGAPVVGGETRADGFELQRETPHKMTCVNIVRKEHALMPADDTGGSVVESIPDDDQTIPCLSEKQLVELARAGLMIERYYKQPQDIEFAFDDQGALWFLQSRPLNIKEKMSKMVCDVSEIAQTYQAIFSGRGLVAENGIATGRVFLYGPDSNLDRFPHGAILVAKHASPKFARIARRAAGIITDIGSPAGHMATIAREFRVPTLVDTGIATERLQDGQEITLDADQNVVYDGNAKELCYYEFSDETFAESYEYRLLKRVLTKISPLNFTNPEDKRFKPKYCRTLHDITRFVHEKAVEELIHVNLNALKKENHQAVRLELSVPIDLMLMDIGGGITSDRAEKNMTLGKTITTEDVVSHPLRAFLSGMTQSGMWRNEPMSVDFSSFMSSLTRTFSFHQSSPRDIGQNLAVFSREYANISLRLGYHFNMIDAYMCQNPNDNYAYFRFFGGVTDAGRRSRRVAFLAQVLERGNFRVEHKGDLVVARIKKLSWEGMEQSMRLIGQLVAFTRQLDVKMINDQYVLKYVDDFWAMVKKTA